jgi:hypothetical protein
MPDDTRARWREALRHEIPEAARRLAARQGGAPLRTFALVTDEDLRTLYAAGCTAERLASLDRESAKYPAEWPEDGVSMRGSSLLQEGLADGYATRSDSDWKRSLIDELAATLDQLRKERVFDDDTLLLVWSHDPEPREFAWLFDASKRINPRSQFRWWARAMRVGRWLARLATLLDPSR